MPPYHTSLHSGHSAGERRAATLTRTSPAGREVSHRIADPRIHRLMGQWLRAGVMEGGECTDAVEGHAPGSGISPLLFAQLLIEV